MVIDGCVLPGRRCTIYVGVSCRGRVRGVQADWKERDVVCMMIDDIMHNSFSPSIKHHQYKVLVALLHVHLVMITTEQHPEMRTPP